MYVGNIIIDEVSIGSPEISAHAESLIYKFQQNKWVSAHFDRKGPKLGPLVLIEDQQNPDEHMDPQSKTNFGKRMLKIENSKVFFEDTWTIPSWSIYTLLLPINYVAIDIQGGVTSDPSINPQIKTGVDYQGRIFYYAVFDFDKQCSYDISAIITKDSAKYKKTLTNDGKIKYSIDENLAKSIEKSPYVNLLIKLLGAVLGSSL